MNKINAKSTLEKVLAESLGLPEYEYIMKNVHKTDVSRDENFQRKFNHFYKVRRNDSGRQDSMIEIYGKIEDWYRKYLDTVEAKENIRVFDEMLPEYTWISDTKKIDYIIWGTGF